MWLATTKIRALLLGKLSPVHRKTFGSLFPPSEHAGRDSANWSTWSADTIALCFSGVVDLEALPMIKDDAILVGNVNREHYPYSPVYCF